jgi:tetratricopeptide (TPR) repeat protein
LFHAANTVLLFLLLKRMTGVLWRSAFVAALFAFHPLHVESVAWISERKDVLSTFFGFLTLWAYARYAKEQGTRSKEQGILENRSPFSFLLSPFSRFYFLALFFFALGLMSKPMLVTLPFVLLLLDFWPLQRFAFSSPASGQPPAGPPWATPFRLLLEKLPFFALAAASCVVTVLAQKHGQSLVPMGDVPFERRLQTAIVSYLFYLGKMLWPTPLAVFYPYPVIGPATAAVAAYILFLISLAVFILVRRRPYLAMGWLWYLGTLVPVIGLVQVGMQGMADRYTYVPLIGLFIAITWGVWDVLSGWRYARLVMIVASVAVLAACMTLTAAQVRWWRNSETLARHALAVTATNVPMEMVLGDALLEQGKFEEAARHFEEAAKISPSFVPIQNHLVIALAGQGKVDEAIAVCRIALKIEPHAVRPHYMLANLLSQRGQWLEAIAEYQTTLRIDPNHPLALNDLAWLLATAPDARLRNGAEAVELAEKACRLTDYKVPLLVSTLAAAYAEAGRFDDAVKTAEQAITLATADGEKALVVKTRESLELYQAHEAYHEPASH